jgi:hypothetical protein
MRRWNCSGFPIMKENNPDHCTTLHGKPLFWELSISVLNNMILRFIGTTLHNLMP